METLPERINAIKAITYYIPDVVHSLEELGYADDEINLEKVMEYIEDWLEEDFSGLQGVIFQDENGEEL